MPSRVLTTRELNRALHERQLLLGRRRVSTHVAVERLVGLQAQVPRDPYVALWTRLDGFRPEALARAMAERRAVRMTLLRGTLHLVTARDAIALRPLVQPAIERTLFGSSPLRHAVDRVDLGDLLAFIAAALEERPRSRSELVREIATRWPRADADALAYAMYLVPTVQVTPRGIWGRTGPSAFTTVRAWVGRDVERRGDVDRLVRRYLAAFGPATVADARSWSGIPGLREAFERLRRHLRTFADAAGRELFDVPRAPLPDPAVPAPVRFLPEYDNVLLAHQDRDRIVAPGPAQWSAVGWGAFLVDGSTAGRWRVIEERERAVLRVEPMRDLRRHDRDEIRDEAERLVSFLAPGTAGRAVDVA